MNVGIFLKTFSGGIVGDVETLRSEVVLVANAMLVTSGMSDLAWTLLSHRVRVAAFDELYTAGCALMGGRRDEHVNVIGHYGEAVEEKFAGVSIAKECGDEELGVCVALKMAAALERRDRYGVCALLLADGGHIKESIPQGLKPVLWRLVSPKAEALGYLEATATATARTNNTPLMTYVLCLWRVWLRRREHTPGAEARSVAACETQG